MADSQDNKKEVTGENDPSELEKEKNNDRDILKHLRPEEILGKYREKLKDATQETLNDYSPPARQCLFSLLDSDSFNEAGIFTAFDPEKVIDGDEIPGDGISCGFGEINKRQVAVILFDSSVKEGTFSRRNCRVLKRFIERVRRKKLPLLIIVDSAGIRPEEGATGLGETAEVMEALDSCRGEIPRISLVAGEFQHTAAMLGGICDLVFGINNSPAEENEEEEGIGEEEFFDLVGEDKEEVVELTIKCLNYLPDNSRENSFVLQGEPPELSRSPGDIVPADKRKPYDVKEVLNSVFDGKSFLEIKPEVAKNIVTGFGRLEGRAVGIIANQPRFRAGTLDGPGSDKATDFLNFCEMFNFPVVSIVDLPGFLPASEREQAGIINRAARLFSAYCEANIPLVTLITRKAYDTAYTIMGSPAPGVDYVCAWHCAEVAVTGNVRENEELESDFYQFGDPWEAAGEGYIDKIIRPEETRETLIDLVSMS